MAGIAAARARGRTGGRKPKLSPEQQRVAAEMARGGWPLPRLRRRSSVRGIRCIRRWSRARSRSNNVPPADAEEPFRPRHSSQVVPEGVRAPRVSAPVPRHCSEGRGCPERGEGVVRNGAPAVGCHAGVPRLCRWMLAVLQWTPSSPRYTHCPGDGGGPCAQPLRGCMRGPIQS